MALAWALETKEAFDRQRVRKGHSRLKEGKCRERSIFFQGWTTRGKEEVTEGRDQRGLRSCWEGSDVNHFFSFFFWGSLGLHPWHMEVPRLGVELEL